MMNATTQPVTLTQTSHAQYRPTLTGAPVWQADRTIITAPIAGEWLEIVDTAVTSHVHNLLGNMIRLDLTDLTPAALTTHDAVAGYWFAVAQGWAARAADEREVA